MSGPSVVVVGGGDAVERAVVEALGGVDGAAIDRVGDDLDDGTAVDDTADVDAVFAAGEAGLLALAAWERDPLPPVFPIAADADRYDIPAAAVDAAADAFATGAFETVSHPVLDVEVDGEFAGSAVADVTLLTSEPARISEYAVGSPDGRVDTVRADGVVTATPLGSAGYARAAGGPLLAPQTGLVAVPISPYAVHAHPWVLRPPMSLSVRRDEAAVSLLLDDEVVGRVPPEAPVHVSVGGELPLVRPETVGER